MQEIMPHLSTIADKKELDASEFSFQSSLLTSNKNVVWVPIHGSEDLDERWKRLQWKNEKRASAVKIHRFATINDPLRLSTPSMELLNKSNVLSLRKSLTLTKSRLPSLPYDDLAEPEIVCSTKERNLSLCPSDAINFTKSSLNEPSSIQSSCNKEILSNNDASLSPQQDIETDVVSSSEKTSVHSFSLYLPVVMAEANVSLDPEDEARQTRLSKLKRKPSKLSLAVCLEDIDPNDTIIIEPEEDEFEERPDPNYPDEELPYVNDLDTKQIFNESNQSDFSQGAPIVEVKMHEITMNDIHVSSSSSLSSFSPITSSYFSGTTYSPTPASHVELKSTQDLVNPSPSTFLKDASSSTHYLNDATLKSDSMHAFDPLKRNPKKWIQLSTSSPVLPETLHWLIGLSHAKLGNRHLPLLRQVVISNFTLSCAKQLQDQYVSRNLDHHIRSQSHSHHKVLPDIVPSSYSHHAHIMISKKPPKSSSLFHLPFLSSHRRKRSNLSLVKGNSFSLSSSNVHQRMTNGMRNCHSLLEKHGMAASLSSSSSSSSSSHRQDIDALVYQHRRPRELSTYGQERSTLSSSSSFSDRLFIFDSSLSFHEYFIRIRIYLSAIDARQDHEHLLLDYLSVPLPWSDESELSNEDLYRRKRMLEAETMAMTRPEMILRWAAFSSSV